MSSERCSVSGHHVQTRSCNSVIRIWVKRVQRKSERIGWNEIWRVDRHLDTEFFFYFLTSLLSPLSVSSGFLVFDTLHFTVDRLCVMAVHLCALDPSPSTSGDENRSLQSLLGRLTLPLFPDRVKFPPLPCRVTRLSSSSLLKSPL